MIIFTKFKKKTISNWGYDILDSKVEIGIYIYWRKYVLDYKIYIYIYILYIYIYIYIYIMTKINID